MNNKIVLQVEGLSKTYVSYKKEPGFWNSLKSFVLPRKNVEVLALAPLSFNIHEGERVGLLGPNGAGKTTTLKMLTGLITPTRGQAEAFGQFETSQRDRRYLRQLGLVMGQRQQLFPDLPALDTFQLSKAIYNIPENEFRERVHEFLNLLDVQDKATLPVRKLSLGERMKMELILSLLHKPRLLFLDEPTIGLDFTAAKNIRNFLNRLNKEWKTTILLTSHYAKDIEELCERVILINHGQLIFDGPLNQLDPRVQGQRILSITFESATSKQRILEGSLRELKLKYDFQNGKEENSLVVIATKSDAPTLLKSLMFQMDASEIADIKIEERGLDEVFSQIYHPSEVTKLAPPMEVQPVQ